ncbi:hypothetical protein M0804_009110 [Polistes exclamans]|nr:hypothetical protein M0804_009110 [Polistes exclamans]
MSPSTSSLHWESDAIILLLSTQVNYYSTLSSNLITKDQIQMFNYYAFLLFGLGFELTFITELKFETTRSQNLDEAILAAKSAELDLYITNGERQTSNTQTRNFGQDNQRKDKHYDAKQKQQYNERSYYYQKQQYDERQNYNQPNFPQPPRLPYNLRHPKRSSPQSKYPPPTNYQSPRRNYRTSYRYPDPPWNTANQGSVNTNDDRYPPQSHYDIYRPNQNSNRQRNNEDNHPTHKNQVDDSNEANIRRRKSAIPSTLKPINFLNAGFLNDPGFVLLAAKKQTKVIINILNPEIHEGILVRQEPVPGVYFKKTIIKHNKGRAEIDIFYDTKNTVVISIPTLLILPLEERTIPEMGISSNGRHDLPPDNDSLELEYLNITFKNLFSSKINEEVNLSTNEEKRINPKMDSNNDKDEEINPGKAYFNNNNKEVIMVEGVNVKLGFREYKSGSESDMEELVTPDDVAGKDIFDNKIFVK